MSLVQYSYGFIAHAFVRCVTGASNNRRLGPSISSNDEAKIELRGQRNKVDVCCPMSIPTSFESSTHGMPPGPQCQNALSCSSSRSCRPLCSELAWRLQLLLRGHRWRLSRKQKESHARVRSWTSRPALSSQLRAPNTRRRSSRMLLASWRACVARQSCGEQPRP